MFNEIGPIADILGISGAIIAALSSLYGRWYSFKQRRLNNEKISVYLESETRYYRLKGELRREEVSRAEVLGRVGMIPTVDPKKRFRIEYASTDEFINELNDIRETTHKGSNVRFSILCSEDELNQFEIPLIPKQ